LPGFYGLPQLLAAATEASTRGCDPLDPSHCRYPFPSDWFARRVDLRFENPTPTGRRVRLDPRAMPRNVFGKPVDPTEWNRNDGFSPGQLIVAFVPGIAADLATGDRRC
jgi:hypothetical protein